jgi:D-sedoheptulose 7-phosphate isomerase
MMKKQSEQEILLDFFTRHPNLKNIETDLLKAYKIMRKSFTDGGQLLICGNGGSTADCDHIVVEYY